MLQTHPPEEQVKGVAGGEEGDEVGVAEEGGQHKQLQALHAVSWIVSKWTTSLKEF